MEKTYLVFPDQEVYIVKFVENDEAFYTICENKELISILSDTFFPKAKFEYLFVSLPKPIVDLYNFSEYDITEDESVIKFMGWKNSFFVEFFDKLKDKIILLR